MYQLQEPCINDFDKTRMNESFFELLLTLRAATGSCFLRLLQDEGTERFRTETIYLGFFRKRSVTETYIAVCAGTS